ncbi:MAG: SufS family cysteine desulfurase [Alphaproteobacteria bacterium]|nr:SufS family cysteine desulfurase [Alphaproteobacteria bacterium]
MGFPLQQVNNQDANPWRADFPALNNAGKPVAFMDSAASAQKPQAVLTAMDDVARSHYANIHRGLYDFSQKTTSAYEAARHTVAAFIKAQSDNEIIFTRNTTEAINLVAQSWGRSHLQAGDEILITEMEHHANIVPWVMTAEATGAVVKYIPVLDDGRLDIAAIESLVTDKTKLFACTHISNAIGVVNDVHALILKIKAANSNVVTLIDASQSIVHRAIDVQALGADFIVFTGHKLYGPSGIGVLWGHEDLLNTMPPYQGGGDMIERVSVKSGITYKQAPARFEAGTPAILETIGLAAAIDYVSAIGMDAIAAHEQTLYSYMLKRADEIDGLTFYGDVSGEEKAPILSFTADWAHVSDIATILDQCGVAVRSGHHCAMPLMERFGIDGTVRASLGLYSTQGDVDQFINALHKAYKLLG